MTTHLNKMLRREAQVLTNATHPYPHSYSRNSIKLVEYLKKSLSSYHSLSLSQLPSHKSIYRENNNNNHSSFNQALKHHKSYNFSNHSNNNTRNLHSSVRSSSRKSPYDILGVSKNASKDEIKKAYFALAKKLHPDVNGGDKEKNAKFTEVNNAYEILSDDKKKAMYDQHGVTDEDMGGAGGAGFDGFPFGFGGPGGGGFSAEDIFSQMFGGGAASGGGPTMRVKGADLQTSLQLSFMEAINGVSKNISVTAAASCTTCDGSGEKKGAPVSKCTSCKGKGSITQKAGFMVMEMQCPQCGGRGKSVPPCSPCSGRGVVKQRKEVKVEIPAGVDSDVTIKLAGQGDKGENNGPAGNLYIRLSVASHPVFKREGQNIILNHSLPLNVAILGGSVQVPTLKGDVPINIDPGTQPNDKKVLKGKGVKEPNVHRYGDQIIIFNVTIPSKLNTKAENLLNEFCKEAGIETGETTKKSFFEKMADRLKDSAKICTDDVTENKSNEDKDNDENKQKAGAKA